MVICELCGKEYKVITNTHLDAVHSITIKKYVKEYGKEGVGQTLYPHLLPKNDPRYIKWRKGLKGKQAWNKGHTKKTHPGVAKISRTMKRREIDNFADWREGAREKGLIPSAYPEFKKCEDLSFLLGMILGDGHIQQHDRTQCLSIALGTDKPDLIKYTKSIVDKVIKKKSNVHYSKTENISHITLYQKKLSGRFGIPAGNKGELRYVVPDWIWNDKDNLVSFLRGLYEAEGSFAVHRQTYTYKMMFCNRNQTLLDIVYEGLQKLGFHPHRTSEKIQVSKKDEVYRLKEVLSFRQY